VKQSSYIEHYLNRTVQLD